MDYGNLHLRIEINGKEIYMSKVYETGGFGATIWMPVNRLSLKQEYKLYEGLESSFIKNKNSRDLTGIWRSTNGNRIIT